MKNPCYLSASITASLGSDLLPHHPTTTTLGPGTRDAILFQRRKTEKEKSPRMDPSKGKERDALHRGQGHRIGVGVEGLVYHTHTTHSPSCNKGHFSIQSQTHTTPRKEVLHGRKLPVEGEYKSPCSRALGMSLCKYRPHICLLEEGQSQNYTQAEAEGQRHKHSISESLDQEAEEMAQLVKCSQRKCKDLNLIPRACALSPKVQTSASKHKEDPGSLISSLHTHTSTHTPHTITDQNISVQTPTHPEGSSSCCRARLQGQPVCTACPSRDFPADPGLSTATLRPWRPSTSFPSLSPFHPATGGQAERRGRHNSEFHVSTGCPGQQHKSGRVLVFRARGNGSPARFPTVS